jgi:hypothetical protein
MAGGLRGIQTEYPKCAVSDVSTAARKKPSQTNVPNSVTGRKSNIATENKLLIYKTIIIPIWTYGLELWGCASKSNMSIIQRSQSKILRMIVDAAWYVSNQHYTPI